MNTTYKHGFIQYDHAGTYFHKEVKPVFLEANADRGYIS
jgi:hypothetical protein